MINFGASEFGYTPHLNEWLPGIQNPDSVIEKTFIFASSHWRRQQSAQLANCK